MTRLVTRPPSRSVTRLHLIRHAIVEAEARAMYYGAMDVALCQESLLASAAQLRAVAASLPSPAHWVVTPLCRTRDTALALFRAGYPTAELAVERDLQEQHLGDWQGLAHAALPPLLTRPAHPFWPLRGAEQPPNGEAMDSVIVRVSAAMERLAERHAGGEIVAVSHGGAIRAALAHAMGVDADATLHLSVQNLSVTSLERHDEGWRVIAVNWMPGGADQAGSEHRFATR